VLFFASAPGLEEALLGQLAEHPDADRLVLDMSSLGRIDYTGALAMKTVSDEARMAGLEVEITGMPPQARRIMRKVFGEIDPTI